MSDRSFIKFNICGSKPADKNNKHFFQVGVLFLDEDLKKGRIDLDSIPVNFNGELHVFAPRDKE